MSSRDQILNNIKKFQSDDILDIQTYNNNSENLVEQFIQNVQLAGAVVCIKKEDKQTVLKKLLQEAEYFIYDSDLAVAENGAIWCTNLAEDRSKLFLSTYLILRIKKESIVPNMGNAYEKISFKNKQFGTFIAGPSKTADIEQSLVLGAHGAMGLYVFLED
jgi:L-lactate dehydrogenase complex protein LldG